MTIQKDEILDKLADRGNVAQFVAFRPDSHRLPQQSYSRVAGYERNHRFENTSEAISALIKASGEKSVNVRSYLPEDPRSKEFVYGLKTAEAAMEAVQRLSGHDPATSVVTTLAEEKRFNTFFRLASPEVIAKLRESFPELPEQPDAKTVFTKLRELRNQW